MSLTLSDIITVAAPAVLFDMNRSRDYSLDSVFEIPEKGYAVYMKDHLTGNKVPIVWSIEDEERLILESDRIIFISSMLSNAVWSLDELRYDA